MEILGICGSLRKKSYNLLALKAAGELMPQGMRLRITRYDGVPLYNQEVQDAGWPADVTRMRDEIKAADGLLIASPEYNFSVSGVLKNLIDWLSRLPEQPFKWKPVAVISATGGPLGGARNQYELRKILVGLDALFLPRPEIFIGMHQTKFDAEGRLADEATRKIMTTQMAAFHDWVKRMQSAWRD